MGKKSAKSKKKQRTVKTQSAKTQSGLNVKEPFGVKMIMAGVILILFTPFVYFDAFFFPYVGPKGIWFVGLTQCITAFWLFLILKYKNYRPELHPVTIAFGVYLAVMFVCALTGVDLGRSLFSKFERMTGVLFWAHLFLFYLVISSTLNLAKWKIVFRFSVSVALLICVNSFHHDFILFSLPAETPVSNSSYLGSYLFIHVFPAVWLCAEGVKKWYARLFWGAAAALMITVMYDVNARAAFTATLCGLVLLVLLYLSLRPENKLVRRAGGLILIVTFLSGLILAVMLHVYNSPVQKKMLDYANRGKMENWKLSWDAACEKPITGWGPENYELVFDSHFKPFFFLKEYGTGARFDRPHNIFYLKLVTTGWAGVIAWVGFYAALGFSLLRGYFGNKNIDFWRFAVFFVLPIMNVVHRFTFSGVVTSYAMFVLVAGFIAFSDAPGNKGFMRLKKAGKHPWKTPAEILVCIVFVVMFFFSVVQPARTGYYAKVALETKNFPKRVSIFEKTLDTSPVGRYQISEYFARRTVKTIKTHHDKIPENLAVRELDFIIDRLKRNIEASPFDFRSSLMLAKIYNVYAAWVDIDKAKQAQIYAKKALEISPRHQEGYWELAQALLYQKKYEKAVKVTIEAIELEPRYFQAYPVALQAAGKTGNQKQVDRILEMAGKVNKKWKPRLKKLVDG